MIKKIYTSAKKIFTSAKKEQPPQTASNAETQNNTFPRSMLQNGGAKSKKHNLQKIREEKLKLIFPRTMADIAEIGGNNTTFAMDAGLADTCGACDPRQGFIKNDAAMEVIDRFNDYFIGWNACAVLKQNWLIDRAITIPAGDAIAPGFKLAYADTDTADSNKDGFISEAEQAKREQFLKDCLSGIDSCNIRQICRKAEETKKTFGYALVVPVVDGADRSKPFNPDGIKKSSYKGMTVIEPMWIAPRFGEGGYNPASGNFYEPEWYVVAGNEKIHKSWCIKLTNSAVPDILKPVYYYGGVPLTQQIFKRVYCAETVANEAPQLAMTKRLLSVEGEVVNAVANPEMFQKQMELFTECRDNFGVVMSERGSNLHQIDTTLTDFDQLIMTQYQLVASIAQMPVTKLLKVQVKGFDSAGNYEMDDYIMALVEIQNNDYTPIIKRHLECFTRSEYGKETNLDILWNAIDTPTEKESAEIREINARRDNILIAAGIISADEARDRLRNDEDGQYTALPAEDDLTDEDLSGDDETPEYFTVEK